MFRKKGWLLLILPFDQSAVKENPEQVGVQKLQRMNHRVTDEDAEKQHPSLAFHLIFLLNLRKLF